MSGGQAAGTQIEQSASVPERNARVPTYVGLLAVAAILMTALSAYWKPLDAEALRPLAVLLLLGAFSAATLDHHNEGVAYSFTGFVLASSLPLTGRLSEALPVVAAGAPGR